jgi:hypothetical protein
MLIGLLPALVEGNPWAAGGRSLNHEAASAIRLLKGSDGCRSVGNGSQAQRPAQGNDGASQLREVVRSAIEEVRNFENLILADEFQTRSRFRLIEGSDRDVRA